jgi:hypothetical protein
MLIGGLWVPQPIEPPIRARLLEVRERCNLHAEMKWTKISRSKLPGYKAFVDVVLDSALIPFRCIVIDKHILDYTTFHRGDRELGFYKFYFQLISRNLEPHNLYWLYTDERKNRKPYRLDVLKLTVNRWWAKQAGVEPLRHIEPRCSHDDDLIQVADILLGAVAYAWNGRRGSEPKLDLIEHICQRLAWPTLGASTARGAFKMNIWKWEPRQKAS